MPRNTKLLVAIFVLASCRTVESPTKKPATKEGPPAVAAQVQYPAAPGSFTSLISRVGPSVVHLRSPNPSTSGTGAGTAEMTALGSGFIIDTEGHILSSHRALGNATSIVAVLENGSEYPCTIVGRDPQHDVVVLKIPPLPTLRTLRRGDSRQLDLGAWVLALGRPFRDDLSASAGIVSYRGHSSEGLFSSHKRPTHAGLIHTDARITRATAGGPLVNMAGELVGMNALVPESDIAAGYAVPLHQLLAVMPMLKKDGFVTRVWLGVFVAPLSPEEARGAGLEQASGALVTQVVDGGPGSKAGLRSGDIIVEFAGKAVDHRSLAALAQNRGLGERIPIVAWRNKATVRVELLTESGPTRAPRIAPGSS